MGEKISASVIISDVVGLYGADIRVVYDPHLIAIADADPGREGVQVMRGNAPEVDFRFKNQVADGEIWYAVTQLNPREPFNGSGTMFSFEATALVPGVVPLTFSHLKVLDHDGRELDFTSHNALWRTPGDLFLPYVHAPVP